MEVASLGRLSNPRLPYPSLRRLLPPPFPALSRPGQIYRAPDSLYDAFANVHGSSLTVRYNDISSLTDFLDGVYVRWTGP
jgi:hypothetical protein